MPPGGLWLGRARNEPPLAALEDWAGVPGRVTTLPVARWAPRLRARDDDTPLMTALRGWRTTMPALVGSGPSESKLATCGEETLEITRVER